MLIAYLNEVNQTNLYVCVCVFACDGVVGMGRKNANEMEKITVECNTVKVHGNSVQVSSCIYVPLICILEHSVVIAQRVIVYRLSMHQTV